MSSGGRSRFSDGSFAARQILYACPVRRLALGGLIPVQEQLAARLAPEERYLLNHRSPSGIYSLAAARSERPYCPEPEVDVRSLQL